MPTYTPKGELTVKPLTAAEKRWLGELDDLLERMPERLYLIEAGDGLYAIDRPAAAQTELHDGKAHKAGIVLASLDHGSFKVTGVAA